MSTATVWIARNSGGKYVVGTRKKKLKNISWSPREFPEWGYAEDDEILLSPTCMRRLFPIMGAMQPGAEPRRVKITMEFEEEPNHG